MHQCQGSDGRGGTFFVEEGDTAIRNAAPRAVLAFPLG